MPNILEAHHISKSYASHQALNDISLNVPEQTIFGLLGPNGAGKTTFIRIITQIIGPDSGEILFRGKKMQRDDIAFVGYLPEERGLYKKMKVGEQVMYFARLKGLSKKEAEAAIKYWFTIFDIKDWWNKKVEELSKGMQQKIQFITSVIHKPAFIILDEPFTGFDPVNTETIIREILKLKENGASILLSTHRMESVEALCDYFTLINKAHIIIEGAVDEVRNRFKTNTFQIDIEGVNPGTDFKDDENFQFEKVEKKGNSNFNLIIKGGNQNNPNQILQHFIQFGQVSLFRELLPSINDIFINLVKEEVHE